MEKGNYNTYTISDSDDSVIIDDHQTNISLHKNDRLSSPEEPEFFRQVLQRQKRKKSLSSEIPVYEKDICLVQKDVFTSEIQNACIVIEDDLEPTISKFKKQEKVEFYSSNQITPRLDTLTSTNNKQTIEVVEPKRKKRLTKEEAEERKKEEKARKDAKKRLVEELKRLNPKECMKYMTVHIDIHLQNRDFSEQILSEIQSTDAKYKIELNSVHSHSVTWSRQVSDNVSKDENCMLLIWDFDEVKILITSNQLLEKINHLKLYKAQLSIIIYGTADQLKKTKSKKNGQFSKSDMLNSLENMMLICHVSFRFVENKNDIGLAVLYFTKAIAQKPYKLNKYKEEQDGCDWYASGHTKNCVTVDKNGTGLTQLWRQMLSQFHLCALETSEAIASVYGSPTQLLEAYDKCSSRLDGETLLQDIPVRRGFGPLASNRRIGPELSKKIYTFFTDNTGCLTLSQE